MEFNITSSTEDLSPYQLTSPREILAVLDRISERKLRVKMTFTEDMEPLLTSVLDINEMNNSVLLDAGIEPLQNWQVCNSGGIWFETVLEQIRILFSASRVRLAQYNGAPAFHIAMPDTVIRLQRRESYRVPIPVSSDVRCIFSAPGPDCGQRLKSLSLPVRNISIGGIIVIDEERRLSDTVGQIYQGCRLELPERFVAVALEIRNARDVEQPCGRRMRQVGCRFVNVPEADLVPIQRYILKLERRQNAKLFSMG